MVDVKSFLFSIDVVNNGSGYFHFFAIHCDTEVFIEQNTAKLAHIEAFID